MDFKSTLIWNPDFFLVGGKVRRPVFPPFQKLVNEIGGKAPWLVKLGTPNGLILGLIPLKIIFESITYFFTSIV